MSETDYNPQLDPWYSPHHIVDFFELLRRRHGTLVQADPLFKKAREMFSAAIAVFGAYELSSENQYYLQANNQSTSPDVMTAVRNKREDGHIELAMIQIEIVEMENHAGTDDIVEFLLNTKLSQRKGYSEKMMIVCFVNRKIPINHIKIHERLKKLPPRSTIYICGRPFDAPMGTFVIFSPYPDLTKPLTYNINDTAQKYKLKSPVTFSLGSTDAMIPTGKNKIDVYKVMGVDQEKIENKIKKIAKKITPDEHHS